jgi:tRNA(Ile2) C34 agmatinyltransferase TiaS
MRAAVLDRAERPFAGARRRQDRLRDIDRRHDGGVGRVSLFEVESNRVRTLDELVTDAWEGLIARRTACCPACHGKMNAIAQGEEGGECADCGAKLS